MNQETIFLTAASVKNLQAVYLLNASLRANGGELAEAPLWVFLSEPVAVPAFKDMRTYILPLEVPASVAAFPSGKKVAACAHAEDLASARTRSLVWIDPFCLVVQPPALFKLGSDFDAAFRPVHIQNVGLPPNKPLNAFWRRIYDVVGIEDINSTITSFVDGKLLRTYFNSHAFAINPELRMMQRWYSLFQLLIEDISFQSTASADESHQIFLFQAILSTLVASSIEPGRLRILPATYNYPYNLQDRIPASRRLKTLNETVCFTYEDRSIHPEAINGIDVHQPLRGWLTNHV
jgi:hypothetical protein